MIPGIVLIALGVSGTLFAEWRGYAGLDRVFKPLASAGFLLAALGAPAWTLPTGTAWFLFAGLALSAVGDVLLLGGREGAPIAGIAAFALAHVAYGSWFVSAGASWWWVAPVVVFLAIGHLAWTVLDPHVRGSLRLPVRGYVALVSLMAACAVAAGLQALMTGTDAVDLLLPAVGGALFYLSDLAVARRRFITGSLLDRVWGLPLYYVAQLLIASAVT